MPPPHRHIILTPQLLVSRTILTITFYESTLSRASRGRTRDRRGI
jgi:hypothetical protein